MRTPWLWLGLIQLCWQAPATERAFNFSEMPPDKAPPGFRSTVAGQGKPGDWKVILDEVPPLLAPLTDKAPMIAKRAVVAQLAQDMAGEHFPMLVFEDEIYGDFAMTTRFKIVSGIVEQMAGVVFRFQNESNFYVVRASALGNNLRCYKVVNGDFKPAIGPAVKLSKGEWHELSVQCEGNRILCSLDGKDAIKLVDNASEHSGKIGFWTMSDSVSYFADTKVTYTPREVLAQVLVRDTLKKYPRLRGLKVYAPRGTPPKLQVVSSDNEKDIGQPGGRTEQDILDRGAIYYAKWKESVTVTMPLRDRNGDAVAAVRVVMTSFPGQTEQNAIVRAMPIIKLMQARIQTASDLAQ